MRIAKNLQHIAQGREPLHFGLGRDVLWEAWPGLARPVTGGSGHGHIPFFRKKIPA
jgi:hypothetical protein